MKACLYIVADGAVIARWDDPAVTDPADFPHAPEGCAYVAVSDEAYDALEVIRNAAGRLKFRYDGAEITDNPKPGTRPFIAICDASTRAVVSLDREYPSHIALGLEVVAVSAADYGAMAAMLRYDEAAPAWDCAPDGTVTPRADDRYNLIVTTDANGTVGVAHAIAFELRDSLGVLAPVTATRTVRVTTPTGPRDIALSLVNGVANQSPTLTAAGRYSIGSADPQTYRVSGTTVFEIGGAWT